MMIFLLVFIAFGIGFIVGSFCGLNHSDEPTKYRKHIVGYQAKIDTPPGNPPKGGSNVRPPVIRVKVEHDRN